MKFRITQHCKERYIERVLNNQPIDNIFKVMLEELKNSKNITSKISTEIPRFILYIKTRYAQSFNILERNNVIYILTKVKNTTDSYSVVTCYLNEGFLDQFRNTALSNEEIHYQLKQLKTK